MDTSDLYAALVDCSSSLEQSWEQVRANGDSQESALRIDSVVSQGFCLLEEFASLPHSPDSESASSVYRLMKNLFLFWYESSSLNEVTLKSWRHFSKITELYPDNLDYALLSEFNRLLLAYCSEGLDVLQIDMSTLGDTVGTYLEQHNSTIKLIGFFTLRLAELLARFRASMQPDVVSTSLVLVLRYVSVLHLVGLYSDAVEGQTTKTLDYLQAAVRVADTAAQDTNLIIGSVLHAISASDVSAESALQVHVGAARYAVSVVEQFAAQQQGREEPVVSTRCVCESISLLTSVVQGLCAECTGQMEDGVVLSLLQRAAQATAQALASAPSAAAVRDILTACWQLHDNSTVKTVNDKCENTRSGVASVSRMLLGGVLACFEEAPQRDIVRVLWHICGKALMCASSEVEARGAVDVLRSVLLVVASRARYELLVDILTLVEVPLIVPNERLKSAPQCLSQSVKEHVLSALPVTYLISLEGDPCQEIIVALLAQSVASIESYTGALSWGPPAVTETLEIGSAVAVLRAASGYLDSACMLARASQSAAWRQAREPILGNISLGTALLRWISSLSDHIKVLLPPALATHDTTSSGLNMHRVRRVEGLVSTLTALVQCLWSHAVPRAVQGILARAAKCCAETALCVLTNQCDDAQNGGADAISSGTELASRVVTKLLHCAGATLKIVGSPSFSEKSIEVVKEVYAVWHRACEVSMHLSSALKGWQGLVRMLSSLQQFANSLPAPLKPRARELVDPALVGVIQARALGRTFSLAQRCDVACSVEADRRVTSALSLGVRAVRLEPRVPVVDNYVPYEEHAQDQAAEIVYNSQDFQQSEEYAAYQEQQGDENERDFEVCEEADAAEEAPGTKRQRSGTQGSQDGESSVHA